MPDLADRHFSLVQDERMAVLEDGDFPHGNASQRLFVDRRIATVALPQRASLDLRSSTETQPGNTL